VTGHVPHGADHVQSVVSVSDVGILVLVVGFVVVDVEEGRGVFTAEEGGSEDAYRPSFVIRLT
jgi:hypothetical protein